MVADIRREGGDVTVQRALDWLVARDPGACEAGLEHGARHAAFNLMTLSMLLGTPLEPDLSGHILLVEEVSERSEEHTSELQSLMRISYAVFCLKKKRNKINKD